MYRPRSHMQIISSQDVDVRVNTTWMLSRSSLQLINEKICVFSSNRLLYLSVTWVFFHTNNFNHAFFIENRSYRYRSSSDSRRLDSVFAFASLNSNLLLVSSFSTISLMVDFWVARKKFGGLPLRLI